MSRGTVSSMIDEEEWRPVVGFEGQYEVSSLGRVKSVARWSAHVGAGRRWIKEFIRKPTLGKRGYLCLLFPGNRNLYVHRLVGDAFLGPMPDGLQTRHLNGDHLDNRVENLRYGTASENREDQVRHGTHTVAARTHCKHGHEFTPENTLPRTDGRGRRCRACMEDRNARRRKS